MESGKDFGGLIQRDNNGKYCIMFLNKFALDLEEIRKIFSEFGAIISIKTAGNERGYRFIRYNHLEEIECAIEGVRNHPKIHLCEHRSNKNNQKGYKNNQRDDGRNGDNEFRNFRKNERINSRESQDFNNFKRHDSKKDSESNGSSNHQRYNDFENNHFDGKTENPNITEDYRNLETYHLKDGENSFSNDQRNNRCKNMNFDNDQYQKNGLANNIRDNNSEELPDLISGGGSTMESNRCISDMDETVIPNLVSKKRRNLSDGMTPMIFTAKEVIVGNIHPDFGAPYILYLFDNFQPLAISNISVEPNSGIRYCSVYFKTIQECISVEASFDKKSLSDKKLIVLRPSRLVEEALA